MRARGAHGFTAVELVIVLALVGAAAMIAVPRMANAIGIARVDRASRTIAIDLEQAIGLAARQRAPVRIEQPVGTRTIVIENASDETVYWTTDLADGTFVGTNVDALTLNPTSIVVFPSGTASGSLTVTVTARGRSRIVSMSQAGQIRVTQ